MALAQPQDTTTIKARARKAANKDALLSDGKHESHIPTPITEEEKQVYHST
jgi:hypothetical protein